MTGPRDDEEQHVVIHIDAGGAPGAGEGTGFLESIADEIAEELRPSRWQRYRYWVYGLGALLMLAVVGYAIGEATYHPSSRLPRLVFDTREPLYGTNAAIATEMDSLRATFSDPASLALEPEGTVYRIELRRTVADRLFGERDEAATVFRARGPAGTIRFLVFSDGGSTQIVAVEAPYSPVREDLPTGVFLALNPGDASFGPLFEAMEALLDGIDGPDVTLDAGDVYVFGPYEGADVDSLRSRIEASVVLTHLAQAIDVADGEVSVAAPAFLVAGGPSRGTINAIYHGSRRAVMEPLWGESSTASLGHELVHAYFDTVVENREQVLSDAADYLERAHPVLHGEVVSDLYNRLGREGRAEESLAFITGALAAGQTKTVSTQVLLENPGNLAISEAIRYSDVGLLVQFGVLPACMLPDEGAAGDIGPELYEDVSEACGR